MTSDTTPKHGIGGTLGQVAGRSNGGKAIVHTIDPKFILGIAAVSEFGSRKYHMRNFLMAPGMCWSDIYGSLMRHLLAYWAGEELDVGPNGEFGETDDPATNMRWSGLPHIDMVAWNVMVLCTYRNHEVFHPGDDRPATLEYVGGLWKEWQSEFDAIRDIDAKAEPVGEERMPYVDAVDDLINNASGKMRRHKTLQQEVAAFADRMKQHGYEGKVDLLGDCTTITIKL